MTNNSRRSFIRTAGVAVSATLAGGSTATAATDASSLQHQLGLLEDANVIRLIQQRYFALLQQGATQQLATLFIDNAAHAISKHTAAVLDVRHDDEQIQVASDRQSATARVQSRLQLGTPFNGEGTLQQMARLQGQSEHQWREQGVYEVHYLKAGAEWKISSLQYKKA